MNFDRMIVDFCQQLIQPNLTLNRNETEKRKKEALANVKPVMYKLKAGEMLVREGERIIRNGKKPDLDEVSDWIRWAQHARSLRAA